MPVDASGVKLSPLDTDRFAIVTARAGEVTSAGLPELLEFCASHHVRLLIARTRIEDGAAARSLAASGAELMDTLVYYEGTTAPPDIPSSGRVDLLGKDDADQVEAIARECFTDYSGHYHADRRLDRTACREVYASWARSCCTAHAAGDGFVLVAGEPAGRVGFSCFRLNSSDEGELVLGAVRPGARGRGLYTQLTLAGVQRLRAAGATRFVTSTQLSNWAAQSAWVRAGLRPYRAYHTFHAWFDQD